jgi:glutamate synthase (NADPH/NADH) small chain
MTLVETHEGTVDERRADCHVTVLVDRCAGCQECVIRCPTGALGMDPGRWVAVADDEACVGCRQCVRTCPFSAIVVEGPLLVAPRTELEARHPQPLLASTAEIRPGFPSLEAARAEAERCLRCPDPTCVRGCPAHNDIPGFIGAIADGDLQRAQRVLRRTSVLPDVCSRVCDQAVQCEGACTWSLAGGEAVAIGALERFVADHAPVPPPRPRTDAAAGLSVGVVGSGPAGIAAASELVAAGASVTVYEADAAPGGLLRWGIPAFTLPDEVAGRPWRQLTEAGVELRCATPVTPAQLDELLAVHDALVLAHGAGLPMRLPVPGADLPGVEDATSFLTRAKAALAEGRSLEDFDELARRKGAGHPRVLVLGAGNTAMDVARSALRLGAQAICVDWMDRRFAPVRPDELEEAEEEGVEVRFCTTLAALEPVDGRVGLARLARTVQRRADERPVVQSGGGATMEVDVVVAAMGYRLDPEFASVLPGTPVGREASGLPDRRWQASGVLAVAAPPFARGRPVGRLALGREVGIVASAFPFRERTWVAGDALVGPSTVVEAMAQGRDAARAVLAARPRRPSRPGPGGPARVLVGYESRSGTTAGAAEAIGRALAEAGHDVSVLPLAKVGPRELALADLVVVGSWVEGLVLAGVGPAKAARRWLAGLPPLAGRPVAVFCTYKVSPKGTLPAMAKAFEARGAVVVASAAFGPRRPWSRGGGEGPEAFAAALVAHLAAARAPSEARAAS